jgi:cell division transport system permease protein
MSRRGRSEALIPQRLSAEGRPVSAVAERAYAVRRTAAIVGSRPGAFLLGILLCAAALAVPLFIAALLHAATPPAKRVASGPEISVFVALGTARAELDALRARLAALEEVSDVRVIPRDQAFADLSKRAGLAAAAGSRANPLPDVLVARYSVRTDPTVVERAAAAVKGWPNVDAVQTEIEWHRRLAAGGRALIAVVGAIGGLTLLLIVLVLVTATQSQIRLRQEETGVLRLVGARPSFIVRPYAYVSALTLGLGAMLALALTVASLRLVEARVAALADLYGQSLTWPSVPIGYLTVFVVAALGLGWVAGWIGAHASLQSDLP